MNGQGAINYVSGGVAVAHSIRAGPFASYQLPPRKAFLACDREMSAVRAWRLPALERRSK